MEDVYQTIQPPSNRHFCPDCIIPRAYVRPITNYEFILIDCAPTYDNLIT